MKKMMMMMKNMKCPKCDCKPEDCKCQGGMEDMKDCPMMGMMMPMMMMMMMKCAKCPKCDKKPEECKCEGGMKCCCGKKGCSCKCEGGDM